VFLKQKRRNLMNSIVSFGSTYRIPVTQAGVNSAKKEKLRDLILSYPNGLIGKSKTGHARISVPDSEDANFIAKLKKIGYKVFQKFEGNNIPKEDLDEYIKLRLDTMDYAQRGKSPKRMSTLLKNKRRYERNYTPKIVEQQSKDAAQELSFVSPEDEKFFKTLDSMETESLKPSIDTKRKGYGIRGDKTMEEIMATDDYKKCVEEYGVDFANAVYFNIK